MNSLIYNLLFNRKFCNAGTLHFNSSLCDNYLGQRSQKWQLFDIKELTLLLDMLNNYANVLKKQPLKNNSKSLLLNTASPFIFSFRDVFRLLNLLKYF